MVTGSKLMMLANGTIPIEVRAEDLPILNAELAELHYQLRNAFREFKSADKGGRHLMIMALSATKRIVDKFDAIRNERLSVPIVMLLDALSSLDDGNTAPCLRAEAANRRGGRAKSSGLYVSVQALAINAAYQLSELGIPFSTCFDEVSVVVKSAGVKPSRGSKAITARTIRGWKETSEADVAFETPLAQRLYLLREEPRASLAHLPRREAAKQILRRLRGRIETLRTADLG